MNKKLMVLFLFMMVCGADGLAQQLPNSEVESLRGLKGVWVFIKDLKSDIKKDGLEKEQIQTDVELRLRIA